MRERHRRRRRRRSVIGRVGRVVGGGGGEEVGSGGSGVYRLGGREREPYSSATCTAYTCIYNNMYIRARGEATTEWRGEGGGGVCIRAACEGDEKRRSARYPGGKATRAEEE